MEYNEYNEKGNRNKASSVGFYAIIGCCLIILGAVAWFAVSSFTRNKTELENSSGNNSNYSSNDNSSNNSSSPDNNNNFTSDVIDTPSSQTAGEKSDVPYSSKESTVVDKTYILPIEGQILKGYSNSALQFSSTFGDMRLHTGIDIKCEKNSQIKSSSSGTVTDIKDDSAFGKVITIDHGDGIVLNYCGLNSISVDIGTSVSTGDIIGTVGSIPSESSDGVHLHLSALIDGKIASPLKALGLE